MVVSCLMTFVLSRQGNMLPRQTYTLLNKNGDALLSLKYKSREDVCTAAFLGEHLLMHGT